MAKDYKELLNEEAFRCLDDRKKGLIINLSEMVKGKSAMQTLNVFMEYSEELTGGKPLTDEERNAIMEVLKSNMNEGERSQFNQMMGMFNMRNH